MNGVRPSAHFERALCVAVVIAGAVGSAVWDVHGVAKAIAAGKLVREAGVARPVARPAALPKAAASQAAASSVVARLAP